MKGSTIMSLFVVAVSMVFVSGVMAQQKPAASPPAAAAPAPEKIEKFSGTVEKVDPGTKEVVVQMKKEKLTFSTGDKTKVTEGTKDLAFGDLKAGQKVSVQYKKEGDKLTAESISVSAPKAKKTAKKEETPSSKATEKAPEKAPEKK